ncbi:MAG: 3-deoxy-manno-octulosonate cytidylyltransferase [Bacteroidetes bacterium]|jgi:3-deoxy-manno-octulosonate cytidylyltransferase (CMP-KDO synthetase)|nr:3-deoxy-manno-octulosonate cytidylyltransferase [Bacteroidota bacterium]
MTVVGVIPARYASTRLPAKPLVDLLGRPMIQRVFERVQKAASIDRAVVATDDERIASVVRSFGGDVLMTSTDIRSGSDRVAAVAEQMPGDIFVNIQGDEPLIAPEMIDEAVAVVRDHPDVSMGTLVRLLEEPADVTNPSVVKVAVAANGDALYFSRSPIPHVRDESETKRWLTSGLFYKHIGIYVFRRQFLKVFATLPEGRLERVEKLEQLRVLEAGHRIRTAVTRFDSIPIDTPEDVARVVALLKQVKQPR